LHLLFIDESGTPIKPNQQSLKFFTFGGVIVPENLWYDLHIQFVELKSRLKYRGEIKWRYFAPYNSDLENPMLRWDSE